MTTAPRAGLRRKLARGGAKRAYWAIGSQALDSASNFFLSVWVARAVGAHDFGAFSAIYVGITMAAMLSRSAANMPMMIVFANSEERFTRRVASDVLGACLAVAVGLGVVAAVFGLTQTGALQTVSLAAAIVAPGLLLQDCCCYVFISRQQPHLAFVNNVVWLATQVPLFLIATYGFHTHAAWVFVLLWGIAAYVSVVVSLAQLKAWPAILRARSWFRAHRAAIADLTVESALMQMAQQGVVYVLAVGVSLVGVAAFRAALVPLGLLRVFFNGLMPIGVTEGARLYARRPRLLLNFVRLWALAGAAVNVAFGLVLIVMPQSIGRSFLGASWHYAHPILLWMTIATAANSAIMPVQAGLRSIAATRTSVKLRVPIVILQLGAVLLGVLLDGLRGGAIGYGLGSAASAVLAHIVFQMTFRTARRSVVDVALPGGDEAGKSGVHRAEQARTVLDGSSGGTI